MKPVKISAAVLSVLLAAFLGLSVLMTSPAPGENVSATSFSARRAAEDLKVISKDVHTNMDAAAIGEVRTYLMETLEKIGLTVTTRAYEGDYQTKRYTGHFTAEDIVGTLKGKSGRSLLLVAHYDSNPGLGLGESPGSHGASDDGYGVSVVLEVLRCVAAQGIPENTLRVVFTDAEETTMLGSSAIAGDAEFNAAASDAVFNIESRGLSGPSILFETSTGNAALIDFYAKNNPHPASWSLATDVYRIMPNYTDFTAFISQGMRGLNFSNLYKIEDNHTARDLYENISLSAIQDYGEQVLPLVSAFAFGNVPETFEASGDAAWFTLARGVFVHFPAGLNWAFLGLAAALLLIYLVLAVRRGKCRLRSLFRTFAYLGAALMTAAVGTGLAMLLSKILGLTYDLTNLVGLSAFETITVALVLILWLMLALYGRRFIKKGGTYEALVIPAILLSVLLAGVFTLFLPGGAFLFSFGAIFASLLGLLALRFPVFALFSGFLAVWVAAPVVYLLLIALTPGALGVVLMFAAFPLFIAAPSLAAAMAK